MAFGKRNQVKIDPLAYNTMLLGISKIGKTSLIKEVCEKLDSNPESYLFMELGSERGADAIQDITYINCPEWDMDYDEYTNSAGFADVCEDIIEHKEESYKSLRVVIWDTYDHLINIAEKKSISLWAKECRAKGKPVDTTINSAWGGFGRGEKKAIELMLDYMDRLRNVGVSVIVIGHCRQKEITDSISQDTYTIITSDQQQNYFNALKKNLHFLAVAYFDRTIKKDKNGNRITSEARKIRFRDSGMVVDCGSRFSEIVDEIDLDADQFIKALEDAIKAEQSKSGKSFEETKAEQDKASEARMKEIAAAEEFNKSQKEVSSVVEKINAFIAENKSDMAVIKPALAKLKELSYKKPADITDIGDALAVLELCK